MGAVSKRRGGGRGLLLREEDGSLAGLRGPTSKRRIGEGRGACVLGDRCPGAVVREGQMSGEAFVRVRSAAPLKPRQHGALQTLYCVVSYYCINVLPLSKAVTLKWSMLS